MNIELTKKEIEELETKLSELKTYLRKEEVHAVLKDDINVSLRLAELDKLYAERDLQTLQLKAKIFTEYINTFETQKPYKETEAREEVMAWVNQVDYPFPKAWGIDAEQEAGRVSVFAGSTGSGKTRLLVDLCAEKFINHKHIAVFTIEVKPGILDAQIIQNVAFKKFKKSYSLKYIKEMLQRGNKEHEDYIYMTRILDVISKFVHIYKLDRYTCQNIYSTINFSELEKGYKHELVAIDYSQILEPNDPKHDALDENRRNTIISKELFSVMIKLNLPCVIFSQMSQEATDKMSKDKVSDSFGLQYSSGLRQIAEHIFKIYREKDENGKWFSNFELRHVKGTYSEIGNYELVQDRITGAITGRMT